MLIDTSSAAVRGQEAVLSRERITAVVDEAVESFAVRGRRVLVVVPDRTRTAPLAFLRRVVSSALQRAGAAGVTYLVALGTHRPLEREELEEHLGVTLDASGHTGSGERVENHAFDDDERLVRVGALRGDFVGRLSGGFFDQEVPLRVNRAVLDHDLAIVLGPVFPHEVVGFSGGNKYFFPGISGAELIDVSHWLGALVTSSALIGRLGPSPVRLLFDEAARQLPIERRCLAFVVAPHGPKEPGESGLLGLFAGTCEQSWSKAATLSGAVHVRRLRRPVRRVVSLIPARYEDLWTAGKGVYKVEPVVADGGEVVLYAPHLREFSVIHGEFLRRVGYHCRDYIIANWQHYAGIPLSVLAHATHVRGLGRYDPASGTEELRISVVLASAIGAEECAAMNLGYRDPASLDLSALAADPETLVVPDAGEQLYRLAGEPDHLAPITELVGSIRRG